MKWVAVDSSSIAFLGYDPDRCQLDIAFRESGDVYRYFEVPAEEYSAFVSAESKGEYLNRVFKSKGYRYTLLQRGHKRIA